MNIIDISDYELMRAIEDHIGTNAICEWVSGFLGMKNASLKEIIVEVEMRPREIRELICLQCL